MFGPNIHATTTATVATDGSLTTAVDVNVVNRFWIEIPTFAV